MVISSKQVPAITVIALVIAVLVLAASLGAYVVKDLFKYDRYDKNDFIEPDAYQAVFLTNDQIYFGHLKNIDSDYLILSDVYYVKIDDSGAGQLVKLGAIEPHGPKDKMVINKDQILFWENIRLDSTVVKTIQNMQQK